MIYKLQKKRDKKTIKQCLLMIAMLFFGNFGFAQTEVEPNNDCSSGNAIASLGVYTGSLSSSDTDDYWILYPQTTGTLTLNFVGNFGAGTVEISYLNSDDPCGARYSYVSNSIFSTININVASTGSASQAAVGKPVKIQIKRVFVDETYTLTVSSNDIVLGSPPVVAPGGVADPNLWYKANDGVTTGGTFNWANQGSMANAYAIQATVINQPVYNTSGANQLNFNPSISFDGTNDFLQTPLLSNYLGTNGIGDKVATQFVVYKKLGSNNTFIYNIDNGTAAPGSGLLILLGGKTDGQQLQEGFRIDNQTATAQNETLLLNLEATTSTTPANNLFNLQKNAVQNQKPQANSHSIAGPSHPLRIGRFGNNYGHFVISELIVYPKILSSIDKRKIQSYLALKYGLSLGNNETLPIYFNSAGATIYVNSTYKYDVFGIGKDDGSGLNQIQSNSMNTGSGDGTGQSGKGNIVLSNPTSLDNGDYLIIGHDNANLTEQTTDLPANLSSQKRIAREWKVKKTNSTGNYNLSFDTKGLCLSVDTVNDIKMLVDSDGDGIFNSDTTINASSYTNGIAYFNGIDLPDNAVFTFLTIPPTIKLSSAAGTDAQTVCNNSAITDIVYSTTKVTNAVVTGLPTGVSANFNSTILTIDGTPTTSGVFTYTIQSTGSQCATIAAITGTITVTALPNKPSITAASATSFCTPGSVILNSSATTGNQWYKDGVLLTGATATAYTATTSGLYTVISTENGCVSPISNQVAVTANATPTTPNLIAQGNTTFCEGGSVRLHTSSPTGNKWFKDGIEIIGATGSDYTATQSGSYTVESINVAGCISGLSVPVQVTVNPNPVMATINGAPVVCANSTITLSNTTLGGVWSSSNTGIATINASGTVTGVSAGNATITYSVTNNSGCNVLVTKDITVVAQPTQPSITAATATNFCAPGSVVLNSSASTGNQWYKDGVLISGATTNAYTATDSGSYTVLTTQNNCSSATSNPIAVTANPTPTVNPIVGVNVVCAGSSIQLTNSTPNGVWSTSNAGIASIDGSGLVTGISAGKVVVYYRVTNSSGCFSEVSTNIKINPLPAQPSITATSATGFCTPGSVVLTSSATTGNQWYKDGVIINGATATAYTATTTGLYTVISTENGCTSPVSNQVAVTANATPTAPSLIAQGNTTFCEGGSVRLHTSSLTGNKWFKGGIEIIGETGSDYIATQSGSYTVESINVAGCISGFSVPVQVTVNPNPIVTAITGAAVVCANSTITLSNTTLGGVWSSSNTGITTINASGTVTGVSAGNATITYSVTNNSGCNVSVTKDITVVTQPTQPSITAATATNFCAPGSVVLNSSASTGNQWYKDGVLISGATTNAYTATDSGSYTVLTTQNNCSSATSNPKVVTANPTPTVNPIVGVNVVCAGSSIQLTNSTPNGVWSTSNAGIASVDGSGLVTGISTGKVVVYYRVTNSSGCFSEASTNIKINPLPTQPSITATSAASFCTPGSVVLASSATTGNQWYKDGTIINGATATAYTATTTGLYTVISTENGCASPVSNQVAVTANASPIGNPIIGNSNIFVGEKSQLSNTTSGGVWASTNTTIATVSTTGLVTGLSNGTVSINYTVTNSNGCSNAQSILFTVLSLKIETVDDDYSAQPINASKGANLAVLTNDKVNNGPVALPLVSLSITDSNGLIGVVFNSLGEVVIPIDTPIGTYTLLYAICDKTNPNNCETATIVIVVKDQCDFDDSPSSCDILVHNAFSPNNDNVNELFIIERIENYTENLVEIFNRDGKSVFRAEGYNNTSKVFDGFSNGQITIDKNAGLQDGTYYYVIKYKKSISGVVKQKVGYLYLSR